MGRLPDPVLAERRRQQILQAALQCFRRRGFHQASMQEICAEAALSAGAFYRYFSSKADLITAIAEDEQHDTIAALDIMESGGGVLDAITAFAERILMRFDRENGAICADVYAEAARDPLLARRLGATESVTATRLADALRAAAARGEIDPAVDPDEAASVLLALIDGMGFRRMVCGPADELISIRALAARYLAVHA